MYRLTARQVRERRARRVALVLTLLFAIPLCVLLAGVVVAEYYVAYQVCFGG